MSDQPPIIVKKVKGHGGHHGGAWKVAYADFVTAMMALFIVLWVLGQSEEVKKSVEEYFKHPTIGFSDKGKGSIVAGNGGQAPKIMDSETDAEAAAKMEKERLQKMGEQIKSDLTSRPEFKDLADKVKVEVTDEGLRIEMLEISDNMFFEKGTSSMKPSAKDLLIRIGNELNKLPNHIVLEGHTDATPFPGTGRTNFELSAERANSARFALCLSEMPQDKIDEVRGYADRKLKDVNDPYSSVNRRISIIVKYGNKK